MSETVDLVAETLGDRVRLLAPGVGFFTCTLPAGTALEPGQFAGVLTMLGRSISLRVPADVRGAITTPARERVSVPVGFGDVLYELSTSTAGPPKPEASAIRAPSATGASLQLPSPQTGRFYHRSAPGEPAFVAAGQTIEDGEPVGLLEVMKTFSHVPYRSGGGLPRRAKVVRVLAKDGADVKQGEPLLEVEPA
jgi:acetyl-CoA carboxylase biotin carboxyl carrier protein